MNEQSKNVYFGYLTLPKELAESKPAPTPLSRGECRFCNQKTDVFTLRDGSNTQPIVIHTGKACQEFRDFFSKPGASSAADQREIINLADWPE